MTKPKELAGMFTYDQLYTPLGKKKSVSLILETCKYGNSDPLFTIRSHEKRGLISLRNLYLKFAVDDPSEAEFAVTVFGDVAFWEHMKTRKDIEPYVEEWRETATILRKSKAFKVLASEVSTKGKNSYQAAKYLIEEPWKIKEAVTPKGKVEAKKALKRTATKAFESKEVSEDIKRLTEEGHLH